jgi:hypothetical protein
MSLDRGAALVSCQVCDSDAALDDDNVVRCAQIATFVAAHRHSSATGTKLSMRLVMPVGDAYRLSGGGGGVGISDVV